MSGVPALVHWAPTRRLRHLEGVSIHNLDVLGHLQYPSDSCSFSYALDWQREGEGLSTWHHYYCSEQTTGDMVLSWDSISPPRTGLATNSATFPGPPLLVPAHPSPNHERHSSTTPATASPAPPAAGFKPITTPLPEHSPEVHAVRLRVFCHTTRHQPACTQGAGTPNVQPLHTPQASCYPGLRHCRNACAQSSPAIVSSQARALASMARDATASASGALATRHVNAKPRTTQPGAQGLSASALTGIAEGNEEEKEEEEEGAGANCTPVPAASACRSRRSVGNLVAASTTAAQASNTEGTQPDAAAEGGLDQGWQTESGQPAAVIAEREGGGALGMCEQQETALSSEANCVSYLGRTVSNTSCLSCADEQMEQVVSSLVEEVVAAAVAEVSGSQTAAGGEPGGERQSLGAPGRAPEVVLGLPAGAGSRSEEQNQQQQEQQKQQHSGEQQWHSLSQTCSLSDKPPPTQQDTTELIMELQFGLQSLVPAGEIPLGFSPNTVVVQLTSGELCLVPEHARVLSCPIDANLSQRWAQLAQHQQQRTQPAKQYQGHQQLAHPIRRSNTPVSQERQQHSSQLPALPAQHMVFQPLHPLFQGAGQMQATCPAPGAGSCIVNGDSSWPTLPSCPGTAPPFSPTTNKQQQQQQQSVIGGSLESADPGIKRSGKHAHLPPPRPPTPPATTPALAHPSSSSNHNRCSNHTSGLGSLTSANFNLHAPCPASATLPATNPETNSTNAATAIHITVADMQLTPPDCPSLLRSAQNLYSSTIANNVKSRASFEAGLTATGKGMPGTGEWRRHRSFSGCLTPSASAPSLAGILSNSSSVSNLAAGGLGGPYSKGDGSMADVVPVSVKSYDVLDVKSGIRRLEAQTQRLLVTQARRERARERLHQLLHNQGACTSQVQRLQAQAVAVCKEERRAEAAAQALQVGQALERNTHAALQKRLQSLRAASYTLQGYKSQHKAAVAAMQGPEGMQRLQRLHAQLACACNTLVAGIAGLYALGPLPPPPAPSPKTRKDASPRILAATPGFHPSLRAASRSRAAASSSKLLGPGPSKEASSKGAGANINTGARAPSASNDVSVGKAADAISVGSVSRATSRSISTIDTKSATSSVGPVSRAASGSSQQPGPPSHPDQSLPQAPSILHHPPQQARQLSQHHLQQPPHHQQQQPQQPSPRQLFQQSTILHHHQQQPGQSLLPPSLQTSHARSLSDNPSLQALFSPTAHEPPPTGHRHSHTLCCGSSVHSSRKGGVGGLVRSDRGHSTHPQQQLPLEALLEASWWASGASAENDEEGMSSTKEDGEQDGSDADDTDDSETLSEVIHGILRDERPSSRASATDLAHLSADRSRMGSTRPPLLTKAQLAERAASGRPLADKEGELLEVATSNLALVSHLHQEASTSPPLRAPHSHVSTAGSTPPRCNGRHNQFESNSNSPPPLAVQGIVLTPNLSQRSIEGTLGWEGMYDEEQRVAAALGYVAHMVDRIASYCEVPLRYPLRPMLSTSLIMDPSPPASEARDHRTGGVVDSLLQMGASALGLSAFLSRSQPQLSDGSSPDQSGGLKGRWGPASLHWKGEALLPLYYDSRDRTRFAVAIYFLNKDVEQLLQAHGLSSAGPMQLLMNLYTLSLVAASGI